MKSTDVLNWVAGISIIVLMLSAGYTVISDPDLSNSLCCCNGLPCSDTYYNGSDCINIVGAYTSVYNASCPTTALSLS